MNPHCECPVSGYCARHQKNKGPEQHKRCNGTADSHDSGLSYWNAWEQGRAGATAPPEPKLNPEGFGYTSPPPVIYQSSVGTELGEIIKSHGGIPCEQCLQRIESLNSKTVDECREAKHETVSHLVKVAKEAAPKLWQRIAISADSLLHTGQAERMFSEWFDTALERGSVPKKVKPAEQQRLSSLRAKAAVAAEVEHISRSIEPHSKPNSEQNQLYRKMLSASKPEPRPFASTPVFNLVWHFWPIAGAWEWHADNLRELLPMIDGKKIIGIVTDKTTVPAQQVIDRIADPDVIYLLNQNVPGSGDLKLNGFPFGEVITAQEAFEMLRDTGDSITVYGHAKGARTHTRNSEAVRLWTEMMYETVTFAKTETIAALEAGYDFIGSFRTFGFRPLVPKNRWHYSGTFYNFRTQQILSNGVPPIAQKYGGTESWPGDITRAENAWCEFADNSPMLRQYDRKLMHDLIPDQLHWESKRYGDGPKTEQHRREFDWLISQLRDCRSLLVIGSRHGGLEHHIAKLLPQLAGQIVAIDCDPLPGNTSPRLIVGSSHDATIMNAARQHGPFDAVFIDGDHSELGARLDWAFARSLQPRKVFFHDFTDAAYHKLCGCEVYKMWPEVIAEVAANGWSMSSKVVGCGWGGIAMVDMT